MIDGLFKVDFQTPLGAGSGVVHLQGGRIWGGDAGLFYVGTYTEDGSKFAAQVQTDRHTRHPGIVSVFGVDRVNIDLAGTINGTTLITKGTASQAPGVSFDALLTRIAD